MRIAFVTTVLTFLLLVGCTDDLDQQKANAPAPEEITREDIGYYCNMIVADHLGPKGQVHIDGRDDPVWFSSVRDAIVFTLLPEEPKNIAAIYVNDMGRASWENPEAGTWIDARRAWYVIGSAKVGGMGAPEAVPFGQKADAEAFVERNGGQVVAFDSVPKDYVLNDASQTMQADMQHGAGDTHQASHDAGAMPTGTGTGNDMSTHNGHEHNDKKVVK